MENLENSLVELIEYFKSVAPEGWAIILKQQLVEGWVDVILGSLALLLFFLLFIAMKRLKLGYDSEKYASDTEDWAIGMVGVGLIQLISVIFSVVNLVMGIKILVNPEYYAIMDILGNLK